MRYNDQVLVKTLWLKNELSYYVEYRDLLDGRKGDPTRIKNNV